MLILFSLGILIKTFKSIKGLFIKYDFLKIEKPKNTGEIEKLVTRGLMVPDYVDKAVDNILNKVRSGGDRAVLNLCRQFDNFEAESIDDIKVKGKEIDSAFRDVKKNLPDLVKL